MSDKRNDRLFLLDIIESCHAIIEYCEGLTFEGFAEDRKTRSAVIREFEIIGEAVGNLSEGIKIRYSEIEWQDIKDFRNILVHEYFGVDSEIAWNVVRDDVPALIKTVTKMLEEHR